MAVHGSTQLLFGPFRLEPQNARLWRGDRPVPLQPKALTVLRYLAERAGDLATKDDLLDAGWPGVFVGDAALKVCIREIRRALGDDADKPLVRRDGPSTRIPVHCAGNFRSGAERVARHDSGRAPARGSTDPLRA